MRWWIEFDQFYLSMSSQDPQQKSPMRSLYIDDIPGTRPAKRVYQKSNFMARHNEEIHRFGQNPEDRVIDWYTPTRKVTQPMERSGVEQWKAKEMQKSRPIKDLMEREGTKSVGWCPMAKSSILGGSGLHSLTKSSDNPYFPHRYIDPRNGESNKWSGQRSWVDQPTEFIKVTSTKVGYFGK